MIGATAKLLWIWHELWVDGRLRATEEILGVHVTGVAPTASPLPRLRWPPPSKRALTPPPAPRLPRHPGGARSGCEFTGWPVNPRGARVTSRSSTRNRHRVSATVARPQELEPPASSTGELGAERAAASGFETLPGMDELFQLHPNGLFLRREALQLGYDDGDLKRALRAQPDRADPPAGRTPRAETCARPPTPTTRHLAPLAQGVALTRRASCCPEPHHRSARLGTAALAARPRAGSTSRAWRAPPAGSSTTWSTTATDGDPDGMSGLRTNTCSWTR